MALVNMKEMLLKAKEGKYTDLAILGIGGSRHTTESMMKLLGMDAHIHFYSSVDPESFKRFINTLDLDKTKFLVVSKSGGTLETTTAYESAKKLMQEHLGKDDVSDRFIAMTDISSEKSNLRRIVNSGEIKLSGLVHDDVGGRFSVLTAVGLLPIAASGLNIDKLMEGARIAEDRYADTSLEYNQCYLLTFHYLYDLLLSFFFLFQFLISLFLFSLLI